MVSKTKDSLFYTPESCMCEVDRKGSVFSSLLKMLPPRCACHGITSYAEISSTVDRNVLLNITASTAKGN